MARQLRSGFSILFILIACAFFYEGCGSYQLPIITGSPPTFVGLGSYWDLWLDTAGSYIELSHAPSVGAAIDYTALGPYQSYSSTGFTQFNINLVDIGSDGPAAGASTFGFYVNNAVAFLAPFTTAGSIIPFVPPGTCPGDVASNWIKLRVPSGWAVSNASYDAFGTMTYSSASGGTTINTDYNLDTPTNNDYMTGPVSPGTALSSAAGCNSGMLSDGSVDTLVSAYGLVLHKLSDDSVYFGWPTASVSVSALAGNYSGIIYSSGSGQNSGISVTLNSSGAGTANVLSDVTTGATTGTTFAIALGTKTIPGSGFLGGTITFTSTDPLVCLAATSVAGSTQNLLVCDATDDSNNFYSLVLLSH